MRKNTTESEVVEPLAEKDALILAFIRAHPGVSDADIALELNINLLYVQTATYKLVKRRLVTFDPLDVPLRYSPR